MKKIKKIGVLTSGGDAPGMNAAVRAVVREALSNGIEAVGIRYGYLGLVEGCDRDDCIVPMTSASVSNIVTRGGTILYTSRCPEFKTSEGMARALKTCEKFGIDAVVSIGGDGTFRGATALAKAGIPTIGIPATIDNDITATEYTIGFDTAMNTLIRTVDCLRDTCESHARCHIVEVMGRNCGQIALNAGIAVGASVILIPELPRDQAAFIDRIRTMKNLGKRGLIVMVSEGVMTDPSKHKDEEGAIPYSEALRKIIPMETGITTKFVRPGHIIRGGSPTLRDRLTATKMGSEAVRQLVNGTSDVVICETSGKLSVADIRFALMADNMYKNTATPSELESFTAQELARATILCKNRTDAINRLYKLSSDICS